MTQRFRLAAGGRIRRWKPVTFTFDGRRHGGFEGDTLASALLANGVHLVARSFKYHRPRGIMAAGSEEPNALVTVDRGEGRITPNLRATQVEIYEGLTAHSQNRWPSLSLDAGAVSDRLSRFLPAGFYYKTFMWPRGAWAKLYEPAIRRAAGLGKAPTDPDPDTYAQRYGHCDVLVIGAGPAGLAAARAAAATGARVLLADEQADFGGSLLAEPPTTRIEGWGPVDWVARCVAALSRMPNVRLLPRTTAFGYFADNLVGLAERLTDHLAAPEPRRPRERLWQVRATEVVLATGAHERPLVFPGNDRPGVMLADAARTYVARYGAKPGMRAVVATSHDDAYRAALTLHAAGVVITTIADSRRSPSGPWFEAARAAGLRHDTSCGLAGTAGRHRVRRVQLARLHGEEIVVGETLACDLVVMSGGWTPAVHLFSQSRGRLAYDESLQAFVPGTSVQRERSAGACRGTADLNACIAEGAAAGETAAKAAKQQDGRHPSPRGEGGRGEAAAGWGDISARPPPGLAATRLDHPPPSGEGWRPTSQTLRPEKAANPSPFAALKPGKAFVDFQNDVTAKDLAIAVAEGFRSIEHVKRYTTTGMATDQGKTSGLNALGIVAALEGRGIPEIGLTTFRLPYTPTTFGAFAGTARGELFDPVRTTPIHEAAQAMGAVFEDVGLWKRARFFPRAGEAMHAAVARECRTVRETVGVFDASTLGKIEVVGPDAAEFLGRIYVNSFEKLGLGRCRYALMLGEHGHVMDDGIVARLASDRFHVTTTTSGAARVLAHMEDYLQTEWPDLQVWLTSTTEQWAVVAVQGPRAREIVAPLVAGIDLAGLPHMGVAAGAILGVPMRLFRASFTGELGFEINVPADFGRAVWEAVHAAVVAAGGTAYGTEAMHVLRAEKGYIIVGQETDGTVTPDDLGLSGMIGKAKRDFVGKRSLARPDLVAPDRKQLVGLVTVNPALVLEEGAQVSDVAYPRPGSAALGHVTSSYMSPTLGRSIALALVAGGRTRMGQRLHVPMPDRSIAVEVVSPVFVDPQGARLHG